MGTNQPPSGDHRERRPSWTVQSVFDPDRGGKDFAYTIGLDGLGFPELHLWARPSLGDDPGEDWMLSPSDRCHVLNELAWQLVDGTLAVGTEVRRTYDDGEAHVVFRVDPPGDIEELEAFGVAAGALVLPVRWSLVRPPEAAPLALTRSHLEAARRLRRRILHGLDGIDGSDGHQVAPEWEVAARPAYDVEQRWGPLTPVVAARAAQLRHADADDWCDLLGVAIDVDGAGMASWPIALAVSAARRAGRRAQVDLLRSDAHALVSALLDWSVDDGRAAALLRHVTAGHGAPDQMERTRRAVTELMAEVTTACLCAEAVADVIAPEVLVAARGPWVETLQPDADLDESLWAPPAVLAVVRRLLASSDLTALCHHHGDVRRGVPGHLDRILMRLRAWGLTGPAGCPWRPTFEGVPAWEEHTEVARLLGIEPRPNPDLRDWASCVSALLTHRDRLTAGEIHLVAVEYGAVVPGLEAALDEPVVLP